MIRLLFIFIISCAKPGKVDVFNPSVSDRAIEYEALISSVQDKDGFIGTDHCDSLLFSGLIGATGISVDIEEAEISPGEWIRRPVSYPECYDNGLSRSRISRDMLLGVLWYAWANKKLDMLERLYDYGSNNSWVMGDYNSGDLKAFGTMLFNPNYINLLARMIHKMGGTSHATRFLPIITQSSCEGFTCHLSTLYLLLLGEVSGLTEPQIDALEASSVRSPYNILHSVAANLYGRNRPMLMNWAWYPSGLPTTASRCEFWATQRDDDDTGLKPCQPLKSHSGGELIFVNWLLKNGSGSLRN